jgi:hypothetical protein
MLYITNEYHYSGAVEFIQNGRQQLQLLAAYSNHTVHARNALIVEKITEQQIYGSL